MLISYILGTISVYVSMCSCSYFCLYSYLYLCLYLGNNWFDLPDLRGMSVFLEMEVSQMGSIPTFTGINPIGWAGWHARAEKIFEVHEVHRFDQLQWAFMSMEGEAMHWFSSWFQEDFDADWKSFSKALIRRFGTQAEKPMQEIHKKLIVLLTSGQKQQKNEMLETEERRKTKPDQENEESKSCSSDNSNNIRYVSFRQWGPGVTALTLCICGIQVAAVMAIKVRACCKTLPALIHYYIAGYACGNNMEGRYFRATQITNHSSIKGSNTISWTINDFISLTRCLMIMIEVMS